MIEGLVVNGCSYMDVYAAGGGHIDLAKKLKLDHSESISQSGCSNSRIIRTTLKHSYFSKRKNLYILGTTFISRNEAPILRCDDPGSFEGRWTNPQNQMYQTDWDFHWTKKDTDNFVNLKLKEEINSITDRTEDLMYRLLSLIESLNSRGHQVLIYQQADTDYLEIKKSPRLRLFKTKTNFVMGFLWSAIQWQHSQGVPVQEGNYNNIYGYCPDNMKHRAPGHHDKINEFLTEYIQVYRLLE